MGLATILRYDALGMIVRNVSEMWAVNPRAFQAAKLKFIITYVNTGAMPIMLTKISMNRRHFYFFHVSFSLYRTFYNPVHV